MCRMSRDPSCVFVEMGGFKTREDRPANIIPEQLYNTGFIAGLRLGLKKIISSHAAP